MAGKQRLRDECTTDDAGYSAKQSRGQGSFRALHPSVTATDSSDKKPRLYSSRRPCHPGRRGEPVEISKSPEMEVQGKNGPRVPGRLIQAAGSRDASVGRRTWLRGMRTRLTISIATHVGVSGAINKARARATASLLSGEEIRLFGAAGSQGATGSKRPIRFPLAAVSLARRKRTNTRG